MAHALEEMNGEVAFALRGAPAWHNLANVLFDKDEHINTQTMLDSAKLSNWNVRLEEIENPEGYQRYYPCCSHTVDGCEADHIYFQCCSEYL